MAQKTWSANPRVPLTIFKEPQPGLSYARQKGVNQAMYSIIAFIDDDNHLPPEWLKEAYRFMTEHPDYSACGGPIIPKCESQPPPWFYDFQGNYSTYDYYREEKNITHALAGAGLILRKQHLANLYEKGFSSMLTDRKGSTLSSGGDYELCYALLLAGRSIGFSPKLKIYHFIQRSRLQWSYLKRLNRGFGEQAPILEMYERLILGDPTPFCWKKEFSRCLFGVCSSGIKTLLEAIRGNLEGSHNQLLLINQYFRLICLLRQRNNYDRKYMALKKAPWNKINPIQSNASS
jgi:glycosyltransferase involved in cell wall biosynthesis